MANPMSMKILLVVVLTAVAAVVKVTEAATYVVGDSTGWVVPMNNPTLYTTWTNGKNFSLGDVLEFNFATGSHDVATVSKTEYDACSIANPITLVNTGPYNYTINSTGTHYFICTFSNGGHCSGGQKLAISTGNTNATSPGSPPTTPSSPPPPPPPASSSASSLAATSPLVFMTIALAFFY